MDFFPETQQYSGSELPDRRTGGAAKRDAIPIAPPSASGQDRDVSGILALTSRRRYMQKHLSCAPRPPRPRWPMRLILLGLLGFATLTLILQDVPAQNPCLTCNIPCNHTTRVAVYGDLFCNCPTAEYCTFTEFCDECFGDGIYVCIDSLNHCGSSYQATFGMPCGCDLFEARGSCSVPNAATGN